MAQKQAVILKQHFTTHLSTHLQAYVRMEGVDLSPDMQDMPPDVSDRLASFCSITGSASHVAEHYLSACNWDLDRVGSDAVKKVCFANQWPGETQLFPSIVHVLCKV